MGPQRPLELIGLGGSHSAGWGGALGVPCWQGERREVAENSFPAAFPPAIFQFGSIGPEKNLRFPPPPQKTPPLGINTLLVLGY